MRKNFQRGMALGFGVASLVGCSGQSQEAATQSTQGTEIVEPNQVTITTELPVGYSFTPAADGIPFPGSKSVGDEAAIKRFKDALMGDGEVTLMPFMLYFKIAGSGDHDKDSTLWVSNPYVLNAEEGTGLPFSSQFFCVELGTGNILMGSLDSEFIIGQPTDGIEGSETFTPTIEHNLDLDAYRGNNGQYGSNSCKILKGVNYLDGPDAIEQLTQSKISA